MFVTGDKWQTKFKSTMWQGTLGRERLLSHMGSRGGHRCGKENDCGQTAVAHLVHKSKTRLQKAQRNELEPFKLIFKVETKKGPSWSSSQSS